MPAATVESAATVGGGPLAPPGSQERWWRLQGLRRGNIAPEPLLKALEAGGQSADEDLLAALIGVLDREGVERLLAAVTAPAERPLLAAGRRELPLLAGQEPVRQAWLAPLLERHSAVSRQDPGRADPWLELLGPFRHPEVAARLRQALMRQLTAAAPEATPGVETLAPLLGLQRQAQDGELLLNLALRPGRLARRRAALEGLALGLSAWPIGPLSAGLVRLSADLDPQLAASAVDLLARLPQGRQALRRAGRQALDPTVRQRWRRRLPAAPLLLLVHGRQGGRIPPELLALAAELERRRGGPVLLQALTQVEAPQPDKAFWAAAQRAGGLTLVPLLLLPGGHVRRDLPALARAWRERARAEGGLELWRQPFLGAWPAWQAQLRGQLQALAGNRALLWLHHPVEGELASRYLAHLSEVLGHPGLAAHREAGLPGPAAPGESALLVPWSLAANRLSEALMGCERHPEQELLPPLLQVESLRQALLELLSDLA